MLFLHRNLIGKTLLEHRILNLKEQFGNFQPWGLGFYDNFIFFEPKDHGVILKQNFSFIREKKIKTYETQKLQNLKKAKIYS